MQNAGISSRNPHILPFLAEVVRKLKFPNNSIEDNSNVIKLLGEEPIVQSVNVGGKLDCSPKTIGLEVKVFQGQENYYINGDVENTIKNILYKPFVKCIEKCVLSGTY